MENILKAPSAQRERPSPLPWEWLLELARAKCKNAKEPPARIAVPAGKPPFARGSSDGNGEKGAPCWSLGDNVQ